MTKIMTGDNDYDDTYQGTVVGVIQHGSMEETRVGPAVATFGATVRLVSLGNGHFPILTNRKMHWKPIFGELAAFLEGATDLATFKKYGCNYWDANAAAWEKNKGKPVEEWRVGKIYGAQWRNMNGVDQLQQVVKSLIMEPTSRRHVMTTWNPADLDDMCLPPCHILTQFCVHNGRLYTSVYMRSVDMCLGFPTDVVLYAGLSILMAQTVGLRLGSLTFMLGNVHVYENHFEALKVHLNQESHEPPTWALDPRASVFNFKPEMLEIINYQHSDEVKYELNV